MAKAHRSLAGQVVAITGGARGIGRATAAALIAQGARVAIGDIEAQLAEQTAAQLGAGTIALPLDVTQRESFTRFLDEVERQLGPLDVLINNAGIMPLGPLVEESDSCTRRMVDINLHGVILGSKLAAERMVPRRRGNIVQIASAAGKWGFAGGATYCATKHAVVGLSEALAVELEDAGVEVNVIMPTVVNTELGSGLSQTRAFKAVQPEDVAHAIVEALSTGRFDVYVPRSMGMIARTGPLLSRRAMKAVNQLLKSDKVLSRPDLAARAAYDARMAQTISSAPVPPGAPVSEAPAAASAPEAPAQGPKSDAPAGDSAVESGTASETTQVG